MGLWNWIVSKISGKGSSLNAINSTRMITLDPFLIANNANKEANSTYMSCINAYQKALSKIKPTLFYKGKPEDSDPTNYLLQVKPNKVQNAVNFWKQVAFSYFANNVAAIWLEWDYGGRIPILKSLYCIDVTATNFEIKELDGNIYYQFNLNDKTIVSKSDEMIILVNSPSLQNPYVKNNEALNMLVNTINANYEGLQKVLKLANVVRFIAQSTQPLKPEDLQKRQQQISDQVAKVDGSGIFYIDNSQSIQQVTNQAKWATPDDVKIMNSEIYSYFGIPEAVVKGQAADDIYQAWVEQSIEPITMELEDELNSKLLTKTEREFGNKYLIDASKIYTASLTHRIQLSNALVASGGYSYNEIRKILGLELVSDDNNKFIERIDRVDTSQNNDEVNQDNKEVTENE